MSRVSKLRKLRMAAQRAREDRRFRGYAKSFRVRAAQARGTSMRLWDWMPHVKNSSRERRAHRWVSVLLGDSHFGDPLPYQSTFRPGSHRTVIVVLGDCINEHALDVHLLTRHL